MSDVDDAFLGVVFGCVDPDGRKKALDELRTVGEAPKIAADAEELIIDNRASCITLTNCLANLGRLESLSVVSYELCKRRSG